MDDKESNLPHLAHLAWNALAILQLYMEKKKSTTLTIEKSESKMFQPGSIYEATVKLKIILRQLELYNLIT